MTTNKESDLINTLINSIFEKLPFESNTMTQRKLLEFQKLYNWKTIPQENIPENIRISVIDSTGKVRHDCFLHNGVLYKEIIINSNFKPQSSERTYSIVKEMPTKWKYSDNSINKILFKENAVENCVEEYLKKNVLFNFID